MIQHHGCSHLFSIRWFWPLRTPDSGPKCHLLPSFHVPGSQEDNETFTLGGFITKPMHVLNMFFQIALTWSCPSLRDALKHPRDLPLENHCPSQDRNKLSSNSRCLIKNMFPHFLCSHPPATNPNADTFPSWSKEPLQRKYIKGILPCLGHQSTVYTRISKWRPVGQTPPANPFSYFLEKEQGLMRG